MSISVANLTINASVSGAPSNKPPADSAQGEAAQIDAPEIDQVAIRNDILQECRRLIRYELERSRER